SLSPRRADVRSLIISTHAALAAERQSETQRRKRVTPSTPQSHITRHFTVLILFYFSDLSSLNPNSRTRSTWLRGAYPTNDSGLVEFKTKYWAI
ncbi:hypothetical protein RSAG8_12564, partial [Rhizoctonia solani AG-8 WAC10335]